MKNLDSSISIAILFAIFALVSVVLLYEHNLILTVLLIFLSVPLLNIYHRRGEIKLFFFIGISGAIAEAIAIKFGAWAYSFPGIQGVPYWLPVLWGIAAVYISFFYRFFSKR